MVTPEQVVQLRHLHRNVLFGVFPSTWTYHQLMAMHDATDAAITLIERIHRGDVVLVERGVAKRAREACYYAQRHWDCLHAEALAGTRDEKYVEGHAAHCIEVLKGFEQCYKALSTALAGTAHGTAPKEGDKGE